MTQSSHRLPEYRPSGNPFFNIVRSFATCSAKVNSGGKQPLDRGSDAEQAMVVAISGDEHQSDWQPAFARQGERDGAQVEEIHRPTMPQNAAGARTEPPVSLPIATSHIPSATATAALEEEPPGTRLRSAGLPGVP